MLVLTRSVGEAIVVGENIRIVVTAVRRGSARVAIEAPFCVRIAREELVRDRRGVDEQEPLPDRP